MKITIVDYGIGNLHSIYKAFEGAGARTEIVSDMRAIASSECIVFPGVGAFGEAMDKLDPVIDDILKQLEGGTPAMGICLGMQILLDRSDESLQRGLGFVSGAVRRLRADRIPQMGWNDVDIIDENPLFEGISANAQFYFANSYACYPDEEVAIAMTRYGESEFPSAIRKRNVIGFQFHPEKSSVAGLKMIDNFVKMVRDF